MNLLLYSDSKKKKRCYVCKTKKKKNTPDLITFTKYSCKVLCLQYLTVSDEITASTNILNILHDSHGYFTVSRVVGLPINKRLDFVFFAKIKKPPEPRSDLCSTNSTVLRTKKLIR